MIRFLKSVTEGSRVLYTGQRCLSRSQLGTEVVAGYSDTVSGRSNEEENLWQYIRSEQELAGLPGGRLVCDK